VKSGVAASAASLGNDADALGNSTMGCDISLSAVQQKSMAAQPGLRRG